MFFFCQGLEVGPPLHTVHAYSIFGRIAPV